MFGTSKEYVKIKREDWEEVEKLFESKNRIIENQDITINSLKQENLDLQEFKHYKAKDDLLYSYEQSFEEQKQRISNLLDTIDVLTKENSSLDDELNNIKSLEKLYLKTISELQSKVNILNMQECQEYETVSLDIYS